MELQIEKWKRGNPDIKSVYDIDLKLQAIYNTKLNYHLDVSPHLVMDVSLLGFKRFPYSKKGKPTVLLAVLLATWMTEVAISELKLIASQTAAQIKALRRLGFTFKRGNPNNNLFLFRKNGEDYRMCNGVDIGFTINPYITATNPSVNNLKKNERCGFTGSSSNLELDHREPAEACAKRGKPPAICDQDAVDHGHWIDDFQMLSPAANASKREICRACMSNGEIIIPAVIQHPERYKQNWNDGDPNSCEGCVWCDYTKPLHP